MAESLLFKRVLSANVRQFSTSSVCNGKRNFRQIQLYNFRGSRAFKKAQQENPDPMIPVYTYGVKKPGYMRDKKFHLVPEMIPELIVPDLTDFKLKPYVSYRVEGVTQSKFTAKDLFDAVYKTKILKDFQSQKLDENGNPLEPNDYEKMTAEKAKALALKTGSDLF